MRAGNTLDDISKPAIDLDRMKKEPVVILKVSLYLGFIWELRNMRGRERESDKEKEWERGREDVREAGRERAVCLVVVTLTNQNLACSVDHVKDWLKKKEDTVVYYAYLIRAPVLSLKAIQV